MEGVNDELSGNPLNSFCGAAVVLVEEHWPLALETTLEPGGRCGWPGPGAAAA